MQRLHTLPSRASVVALSAFAAAALAACGGGGSDGSGLDDATATVYAAQATQIDSDAAVTTDSATLAAQAMIAAGAGAQPTAAPSGDDRATAMAANAQPLATSTKACPGGGTAAVSVTGGTTDSQGNGKFDTGEVYQVVFAACKGAAGVAQLDGTLALTVVSATGDSANGSLDVQTTATGLTLALPRGGATLNGSTERQYSVVTDSNGTAHISGRYLAPSVTLATHYNSRSSTFTLSNTDIQRTATLVGGVLQSTTFNGTHTLSAVLPNATFSYTVATNGTASYGADGVPVTGSWTVTLPANLIAVSVANGIATITVDHGKDGTIDSTFTVPVSQLVANAG